MILGERNNIAGRVHFRKHHCVVIRFGRRRRLITRQKHLPLACGEDQPGCAPVGAQINRRVRIKTIIADLVGKHMRIIDPGEQQVRRMREAGGCGGV